MWPESRRGGCGGLTMADSAGQVLLIQFAKAPCVGRVKTRMIPHLTPRQACELHCELVRWTSRQLLASGLGDVELAVAGDSSDPLFKQVQGLGQVAISGQSGAGLGMRMYRAIHDGLQRYRRVILVGSDCPAIDRTYLRNAVQALDSAPLVFGPAQDGGYVLIGARRIERELFAGVSWGTAQVYGQTKRIMGQLGLDWMELPALADVDRPEDLALWYQLREAQAAG